jgi:nitroreductase
MDVSTALAQRRSIRDFKPDPIPAELLSEVLAAARWAPSWSNTQPYRLGLASGALRDRLSTQLCALYDEGMALQRAAPWTKLAALLSGKVPRGDYAVPRDYPEDLQPARRSTGFGLYGVLGIARRLVLAREKQLRKNYEFFGAPTVVFLFAHQGLGHYATLDAGIWLQSFMLAAQERGLGTCAQGALAVWPAPVRAAFEVPAQYKLLCGCSVGFPADQPVNRFNPDRPPAESLLLSPR